MAGTRFSRRRLVEHLKVALATLPEIRYAIGGATAMDLLGYTRNTRDIDLFVLESFSHHLLLCLSNASTLRQNTEVSMVAARRLTTVPVSVWMI